MDIQPLKLSAGKRLLLRTRTIRVQALEQAKLYVGVKEHPSGSNRGPHIDRWCLWANGMTGYPWCSAFVCGMYREATGLIVPEPRKASVGFLQQWADKVGALLPISSTPRPGDLICYKFDSDNWPDHIGIVDKVFRWGSRRGLVQTIEGNTSAGDDANGGQVQVRVRSVTEPNVRFIRLDKTKLVAV